jgi:hypothetical protein
MKKLYYTMWVDAILKAQSVPENKGFMWKFYTLTGITVAMSFNLMLIGLILHTLGIDMPTFKTTYFEGALGAKMNSFIGYIISFFGLPFLINYFLIFFKKRYKKLIKQYPYKNGRWFTIYFVSSLAALPLLFAIGLFISFVFGIDIGKK